MVQWGVNIDYNNTVSVSYTRTLLKAVDQYGLEYDDMLQCAGIDPDIVENPEARIPLDKHRRFWAQAIAQSGDPFFGLHLAEIMRPETLNIVGEIILNCQTIRGALEKYLRYEVLVGGGWRTRLDERGAQCRISCEVEHFSGYRQSLELKIAGIILFIRWALDRHIKPIKVLFSCPTPESQGEYQRIFQCPIVFGQDSNALVFERDLLDATLPYANPAVGLLLEQFAEDKLAAQASSKPVSVQVYELIYAHIVEGVLARDPAQDSNFNQLVSDAFSISPRTLHRKLKREGCSFQLIFNDVRKDLSIKMLNNGITTSEIAYRVGFSDPAAFCKAFKKWTGVSPKTFLDLSA